jgi:DNA-binding transcriptional ArsR family regulator
LVRVLREFDERVFAPQAASLMAVAERDAAEKRALLATEPPEHVIDAATRGWDYVPEPGIERVILVPSVVHRPFNTTADHHDTRIFCYAVSDESVVAGADDPPAFLVRRLKALADERRLRILRVLQRERRTLQELADEFGLPKTTIHHHLALLRAAGFIHLREDPSRQYMPFPRYTYRAEAVPRALEALGAYLRIEDR